MKGLRKGRKTRVHRLVAQTFIEAVEGKEHVNHIDHNKKNNCVENLEWVSPLDNNLAAIAFYKDKNVCVS